MAFVRPERHADQGRDQDAIGLGQPEVALRGGRGVWIAGRIVRDHLQQGRYRP